MRGAVAVGHAIAVGDRQVDIARAADPYGAVHCLQRRGRARENRSACDGQRAALRAGRAPDQRYVLVGDALFPAVADFIGEEDLRAGGTDRRGDGVVDVAVVAVVVGRRVADDKHVLRGGGTGLRIDRAQRHVRDEQQEQDAQTGGGHSWHLLRSPGWRASSKNAVSLLISSSRKIRFG